jgi:hypothetical protein
MYRDLRGRSKAWYRLIVLSKDPPMGSIVFWELSSQAWSVSIGVRDILEFAGSTPT